MRDIASTRREAALALSPEDVAKGMVLLDALIAVVARKARQLNRYYSLSLFVATLLPFLGIGFWLASVATGDAWGPFTIAAFVCVGLWGIGTAALWWAWAAIQTNPRMGRFGKIPDLEIPSPLQNLIGLYASGARELRTDAGSVVPAAMFASQWAILLFSEDKAERQLVRSPTGVKEVRPVLVLPDVAASRVLSPLARRRSCHPRQSRSDLSDGIDALFQRRLRAARPYPNQASGGAAAQRHGR